MATCWPLPRNSPHVWASRSHVTMLWYSAFSLPWPMYWLVATLNCVTTLPLARLRISGSRVRRPVKRTRFTVRTPSRPADDQSGGPAFRREQCGGHGSAGRGEEEAPAPAVGPSGGSLTIGGRRTVDVSLGGAGRCLAGKRQRSRRPCTTNYARVCWRFARLRQASNDQLAAELCPAPSPVPPPASAAASLARRRRRRAA